jgi:hypothetical protein
MPQVLAMEIQKPLIKKVETSVVNFSINVEMPKQVQTIENIESIADNMESS